MLKLTTLNKKIATVGLMSVLAVGAVGGVAYADDTDTTTAPDDAVSVYRMYNTANSEHLFTTSAEEYNASGTLENGSANPNVVNGYQDWVQEGVSCK